MARSVTKAFSCLDVLFDPCHPLEEGQGVCFCLAKAQEWGRTSPVQHACGLPRVFSHSILWPRDNYRNSGLDSLHHAPSSALALTAQTTHGERDALILDLGGPSLLYHLPSAPRIIFFFLEFLNFI